MTASKEPARLRIVCVINAGENSGDHRRVRELMDGVGADTSFLFVRKNGWRKVRQVPMLVRRLLSDSGDLAFVEGTGLVGGLAALIASRASRGRVRYLVSSGDAAARFVTNSHGPALGLLVFFFERALYRAAAGFVGWTPYLVGRAIRMGARGGLTIEGVSPRSFLDRPVDVEESASARQRLGIPAGAVVICVSGSLTWTEKQKYCYGLELVNAARLTQRDDVRFLIIGDGTGLARLKVAAAGDSRFVFAGAVPHDEMPFYLAAADAAVISQTADEIGLLRLTTKLPEYLALGIPVVVPASPAMLDYLSVGDEPPAWFMQPAHPASRAYAVSLAAWIDDVDVSRRAEMTKSARRVAVERFSPELGAGRLAAFLGASEIGRRASA